MKVIVGNKHHINTLLASWHEFGDIPEQFIHMTVGSNGLLPVLLAKLCGLSTARYWTGNDAWKFKHVWHYRLRAKFINLFFDHHYFLGKHLHDCVFPKYAFVGHPRATLRNLRTAIQYKSRPVRHDVGKVVLGYYYIEKSTFEGRYGLDLIKKLQEDIKDVIWLPILPGQYSAEKMGEVLSNIDIYLRPSRWDGLDPWMVQEAKYFGCEVISTFTQTPDVIKCDPDNYKDLLAKTKALIHVVKEKRSA